MAPGAWDSTKRMYNYAVWFFFLGLGLSRLSVAIAKFPSFSLAVNSSFHRKKRMSEEGDDDDGLGRGGGEQGLERSCEAAMRRRRRRRRVITEQLLDNVRNSLPRTPANKKGERKRELFVREICVNGERKRRRDE